MSTPDNTPPAGVSVVQTIPAESREAGRIRAIEEQVHELQQQLALFKLELMELKTEIRFVDTQRRSDFDELMGKWRELSMAMATVETNVAALQKEQQVMSKTLKTLLRRHQTSHLSMVHLLTALVLDGREPSHDMKKAIMFAEQVFDPIGPDE